MTIDTSGWTGEGTFTPVLLETLKAMDAIACLKLEDAPASRVDAGYAFIANEIYVRFRTEPRLVATRRLGFIPGSRTVDDPVLTLAGLARELAGVDGVGEPDYADDGMLQYLRTERIVPPYQSRGIKVIEMVRIYCISSDVRPGG